MRGRMDEKGMSTMIGAIIVAAVVMSMYMAYILYGVPAFCSAVEKRAFIRVETQFIEMDKEIRATVADGVPRAVEISMGGAYPVVPFAPTPPGYSGAIQTLQGKVEIDNINVTSVSYIAPLTNPETTLSQNCSNLEYIPSYNYLQAPCVYYLYGMVFLAYKGKCTYLYGTFIQNHTIYLPLLYGTATYSGNVPCVLHLYPMSAGGDGMTVTNIAGKNIVIRLYNVYMDQANVNQTFWQDVLSPYLPTGATVTYANDTLTVTLPPGNYTIVGGIVSLSPEERLKPDFLLPMSPLVTSTSPTAVAVKAVDKFGNPVPDAKVTFTPNGTYVANPTSLQPLSYTATPIVEYTSPNGIASCAVKAGTTVGWVVASIRSGATTYELPFTILP